ncbi:MAG: hypothetical protein K8T10_02950 [Candidatus Eremiobacteraeota bacterium]|nr:hypothetical protein [Candidatus Eremiobacteraeota bacterium]
MINKKFDIGQFLTENHINYRGGKQRLSMSFKKTRFIGVLLCLVFLLSFFPALAQKKKKSDKKAEEIIQRIWEVNSRIDTYQAKVNLMRQNDEAFKGIFPPMQVGFIQAGGLINYTNKPKIMQVFLYPRGKGKKDYYYKFTSTDGYNLKLAPDYKDIFKDYPELGKEQKVSPSPTLSKTMIEDSQLSSPTPSPSPTEFIGFYSTEIYNIFEPEKKMKDGSLVFSAKNPINLLIPFTFKDIATDTKRYYKGIGSTHGFNCEIVEIHSPRYGISRLYVTGKGDRQHPTSREPYIVRIDRINAIGITLASARYSNFKVFRKGGRFYKDINLLAFSQPISRGLVSDIHTNLQELVGVLKPDSGTSTPKGKKKSRSGTAVGFGPIWQAGSVATVILLSLVLTFLYYRFWFFKKKREPFAREVIVVEGDRPEEKISNVFADLGIPTSSFSSEKLTEERKLLGAKQKKRPRVVVIAPGMFSKIKSYNFLIKAYVEDGGRVIVFEHGVEQIKDMPFTPTFIPYDRTDPHLSFIIMPKWEKLWKQTSLEEIHKRTAAFYPYELVARIKEKDLKIEPIVVVTNPKTKINSVAISLVYDEKGEYLLVQYRLIEAIRKLKFTSGTAEKMLRDLIAYMFGKEKRIEFAPRWMKRLFSQRPSE